MLLMIQKIRGMTWNDLEFFFNTNNLKMHLCNFTPLFMEVEQENIK